MSMKSFYQIVLLPLLVAITLLVAYYGYHNQRDEYNVWHTERETTVTFTYNFMDYYQNSEGYKSLTVSKSGSQSVKPGHSYQGWWKFTNDSNSKVTVYLRHYIYPMDYIKYVRSGSVPDLIILYPGEQVMLVIQGYIDPDVLLKHDDQPYARSINNRLEVSLIDFKIRDEIQQKKQQYGHSEITTDSSTVGKLMPYKWYLSN